MIPNASAVQDNGDFYVVYGTSDNYPDYEEWIKNGMNNTPNFFDQRVDWLNQTFKLPYDVPIFFYECGKTSAYYHPIANGIVICYELVNDWYNKMNFAYRTASGGNDYVNYATLNVVDYVLLHELGHAFIDIYDLRITGLEEDAADQFIVYMLTRTNWTNHNVAQDEIIFASVIWELSHSDFYQSKPFVSFQPSSFVDTHSLNIQRFHNLACWTYGSNHPDTKELLGSSFLLESRIPFCAHEYNQIVNAWDNHIFPFEPSIISLSTTTPGIYLSALQQQTQLSKQQTQLSKQQTQLSKQGGCLIATAAFGSEMASQVQFLREIRDNTVLQTESGTSFMAGFNQFYYSFSPAVADYERENPAFKQAVKLTLTPLLISLTLLQYADIDSESEMLGYGIGIILLNIGMYFVAPAILIMKIRKRI